MSGQFGEALAHDAVETSRRRLGFLDRAHLATPRHHRLHSLMERENDLVARWMERLRETP
jgi:hypothetical protein